jgi:hypothetical protein
VSRFWRARWCLVRLGIVGFLLYALVSDTGARLARLQYAAMPDFDYAAEVSYLREKGRFGEAIVVADAGLSLAPESARAAIQNEKDATVRAQSSYLRRAKDLGMGALSGRGDSLEGLIGAVTADFFVVGDVRDLVIQGGRLVVDGETDELILILSGVGLATTVAPEVDWVPAVLKVAKKTGAMTKGLAEHLVKLAKSGKRTELLKAFGDVRRIASKASPGGAVRILKHADSPGDLGKLASFVERNPAGAFALHVGQADAAIVAKGARRVPGATQDLLEAGLVKASAKGNAGIAWFRTGGFKAMAKPHMLVGVAKAFWKGNAEDLAARIAERLDPRSWWLTPALATWFFVELAVFARRLGTRALAPAPAAAPA